MKTKIKKSEMIKTDGKSSNLVTHQPKYYNQPLGKTISKFCCKNCGRFDYFIVNREINDFRYEKVYHFPAQCNSCGGPEAVLVDSLKWEQLTNEMRKKFEAYLKKSDIENSCRNINFVDEID